MNLLLLSNSTHFGGSYLDFAAPELARFFKNSGNIAFIPFAAITISYDEYESRVNQALAPFGINVKSVHHSSDPLEAIMQADGIAIGGGNTFRLLKMLQNSGLIPRIQEKVRNGTPYAGWSAGSNVASPTIRTTNDMPVDFPENANALDFVPFQINPHFTMNTLPGHNGETRLQRLQEFGVLHPEVMVYGIPEGTYIECTEAEFKYIGELDYLWLKGREHGFLNSPNLHLLQ